MAKTKDQEIAELRQAMAALIAENETYLHRLESTRKMRPEGYEGFKISLSTGETIVRNGEGIYASIPECSELEFIVDEDYVIEELVADIKRRR
ncbi:hypothetical protein [Bacillus pumilus]|uniref:hypothetical protein n=1 Tax=Bacillus pumilus TaxID=1408 RepID=UPI00081FEB2E|nr:hypothetical protein [Bacillus pumilus]AOC58681.1 hypothetical protein BEN31_18715 [Bacillus pumilus]MBR0588656.1 hypothetical protein [Bacillus pumilus DW2J2]MBR0618624.1 hypothetical protein [Bacillus pumilus]MBR0626359.1 hypothetical protein [Bacillus pumilus]MCY7724050.1 hypothetical protein [Bacillus pumilus]